jgi:RNA polymerase sigma-70 factor (ECF subfamily)
MSEDSRMTKLSIVPGESGNTQRFERLVRPHYDMLYRVAYRFTGSQPDAEDLVQELCVRAYRNIESIADLDNPRTWLLCVLRRLFIDQTRRYDRTNVSSLESAPDGSLEHDAPGPLELADSALTVRRLGEFWKRLGKEQRSLLALHDIEGYSLTEVSDITGLKVGTIKSRLHRARVKLGRMMQSSIDPAGKELERRAKS